MSLPTLEPMVDRTIKELQAMAQAIRMGVHLDVNATSDALERAANILTKEASERVRLQMQAVRK